MRTIEELHQEITRRLVMYQPNVDRTKPFCGLPERGFVVMQELTYLKWFIEGRTFGSLVADMEFRKE